MFHSLKAMQDVHLCMYVCTVLYCMHVCMYIYVSQGDFRLMSYTAGRCGTEERSEVKKLDCVRK